MALIPIDNAQLIEAELRDYSEALAQRPVWMVLSKIDLVDEAAAAGMCVRV